VTESREYYREKLLLWLPLALSWAMMSVAGPIANAGIARLPNAAVNLAAHGLTMSIAVLIESPIIMILSTSVSIVRSRASYELLRRFVIHLSILLTAIGFLVYYTPLYDLLFLRLMGVPKDVAEAAFPALRVMVFWPAAIGWRRLYQGILIRHGRSHLVGYGTVFRLATLVLTVAVGVGLRLSPGSVVGGLAMAASVIVEMVVIRQWTLPLLREQVLVAERDPDGIATMSYAELLRFYVPLAATDAMRVLSQPLTTMGIARMASATLSLAAWPVASGLSSLASSSIMALQEVVLARIQDDRDEGQLEAFSLSLGALFTALLAIVALTSLAPWYFGTVLGVPTEVEALARANLILLVPMPLLLASRNFQRGVLIWRRKSVMVQLGMFINLGSLGALMLAGMAAGAPSAVRLAALATVGAEVIEVLALWRLRQRRPGAAVEAEASAIS
jgi:hypothetical protein